MEAHKALYLVCIMHWVAILIWKNLIISAKPLPSRWVGYGARLPEGIDSSMIGY